MGQSKYFIGGCCLRSLVFLFAGCAETKSDPPTRVGVRQDALGNVVEEIIFQAKHEQGGIAPGPHGPTSMWRTTSSSFYLQERGKPKRELEFLRRSSETWSVPHCHAVDGTDLWAMMTVDFVHGSEARGILVFDKTRVVRKVTIDYAHDWNKGGAVAIAFRNGSRAVVYRSSDGWKSLDVLTGQSARFKSRRRYRTPRKRARRFSYPCRGIGPASSHGPRVTASLLKARAPLTGLR
jgi:hypothetical protein